MLKACSRCGRIHNTLYKCPIKRVYIPTEERKLRNTYSWQKKAKEIKEKANYLCEYCKSEGRYTYKYLEVHHIKKIKDRPDLLLDNNNLICLCVEHHKQADNNEIDENLLQEIAISREKR